jgi:universal stress protein E
MSVQVFVGFEGEDLSQPDQPMEVIQELNWLDKILAPLEESGVNFVAELIWTRDWETSIINAARRTRADMIVLSRSSATNRKSITDSIWSLLRNSEIPVLIIDSNAPVKRENIVVAVNMQTTDDEYHALNKKVLLHGKKLAEFYDAQLHVVNAYYDSEDFPDRDNVKKIIDIDRKNIHVQVGKPEDIIADVATRLQADLVIMGTMARRGIRATLRRNKSEKVIEKLTVDVLTLN